MNPKIIPNGGPAFPTDNEHQNGPSTWHYEGMSLRDHFAGLALNALIATPHAWSELGLRPVSGQNDVAQNARFAYQYADAMLAAREAA